MMMRWAVVILMMIVGAQGEECAFPARLNVETGACELNGGVHVNIQVPAWLADYRNAQATVDAFVAEARWDYLLVMAEEPYRYLARVLVLEISYETFTVGPDVLTLVYPAGRQGPTHAGAMSIMIPLDDLYGVMNLSLFGR